MEEQVYTIGKGKLLFKETGQANYRDLGNAPDFKMTTAVTKKDHYSSRSGTKTKDATAVIEQTATGSFTLDDLLDANLKDFIMSNAITDVSQVSGTLTNYDLTADQDVWQDIGKKKLSSVTVLASTTPADWQTAHAYTVGLYCKKLTTPGSVRYECTTAGTSGEAEPTWNTTPGATTTDGTVVWTCRRITMTVDVDYRLDATAGLLMPLSTGHIADGEGLHVSGTYAAVTVTRMDAAKTSSITGDIWFVGDPPYGKILDVKASVSLTPKGDLSLIGDDFTNLQFEMEFLSSTSYHGLFELFNRGIV